MTSLGQVASLNPRAGDLTFLHNTERPWQRKGSGDHPPSVAAHLTPAGLGWLMEEMTMMS